MAISGGSNAIYGAATFVNLGNNIWTGTWSFYFTAGSNYNGAGAVILTGTLDRLILNNTASTNFTGGTLNIVYQ